MKHKHDMKRKCEEYFPLPWYLGDCGSGTYVLHAASTANLAFSHRNLGRHKANLAFSHRNLGRHKTRLTALQYLVKSANLFPDAVELLKAAQETMNEACTVCAEDLGERCATCDREEIDRRITALLAKLEGDTGE